MQSFVFIFREWIGGHGHYDCRPLKTLPSNAITVRAVSDCTQRLVPCPYAYPNKPCDERFKFANLLRDLKSKHGKIFVMENGASKTTNGTLTKSGLSQYSILPVKIKAYGKVFITSSCTLDGIYYQWVKLLGSPSEAKDFLFSLEYKGPKCTHVFLGEVASM